MLLRWFMNWLAKKRVKSNAEDGYVLGTKPSFDDERDYISSLDDTDYDSVMIEVYDVKSQGFIGSCYAQAICSAHEIQNKIQKDREINLSELWLWFHTHLGGNPQNGGYIRDALKYAKNKGVAMERYWPYDTSKWDVKPSWSADFSAGYFKIKSYWRIGNVQQVKNALSQSYPVVFGMRVHSDYLSTDVNGVIQKPVGNFVGGHAMLIIGFNSDGFIILNSWGSDWGKSGIGVLPYDMFDKYVFESWRIEVR